MPKEWGGILKIKKNFLLDFLFSIDYIIAGTSLVILVLCTVAAVFMRYVVGEPFQWLEEMSTTLFIWFIFFGAAAAVRSGSHVSIDMFVDFLPAKARKVLDVIIYVFLMCLLGAIVYYGTLLSIQAVEKITPILHIQYRYINMPVPIGAALMMVSYTVMFIQKMTGIVVYEDKTGKIEV